MARTTAVTRKKFKAAQKARNEKHAKKVAALEAVVYTDAAKLIRDAADRWTTENMGQDWPDENWRQMHFDGGDDEDEAQEFELGLEDEYRDWWRLARKVYNYVVSKKLPRTLASMEIGFKVPEKQLSRIKVAS